MEFLGLEFGVNVVICKPCIVIFIMGLIQVVKRHVMSHPTPL